jgi:hypothetical protein
VKLREGLKVGGLLLLVAVVFFALGYLAVMRYIP